MKIYLIAFLTSLLFFPSIAHAAPAIESPIVNSKGEKIGKAQFKELPEGLQISINVSGLTPGIHAMHIHNTGVCTPPDFKSAGGHFNPEGKKHGKENPEGFHAGDLPNLVVFGKGKAKVNFVAPGLSFNGKDAILKPGKTALVIHASADDGKTDPSGNSGDRIACGVIG